VLEFEVAEVLVELAGPADDGALVVAGVGAAAGQEDVEQAVAVVVDQTGAAAERLEDRQVAELPALRFFSFALGSRPGSAYTPHRPLGKIGERLAVHGDGANVLSVVVGMIDAALLGHVLEPRL